MDYIIIYQGESIGTMKAPGADESMGMVVGPLTPSPAYEKVRAVFQLFAKASNDEEIANYYHERDELRLSVNTTNGLAVPIQFVHIEDYSAELGDDAYQANFLVQSEEFFKDERLWSWNSLLGE